MLGRICSTIFRSLRRTRSPTDEQEFFHISVAQAEAKIEPDGVTDDLRRAAVVLIGVREGWCVLATILAYSYRTSITR
jgi:hypothetical protein